MNSIKFHSSEEFNEWIFFEFLETSVEYPLELKIGVFHTIINSRLEMLEIASQFIKRSIE